MLRGHTNNVSCVTFVPQIDAVVSNSEDRTMRFFDLPRRAVMPGSPLRRDTDRFWVLTSHPTANLLAAGHDNGLVIYKLGRERPPFFVQERMLYFLKVLELCLVALLLLAGCVPLFSVLFSWRGTVRSSVAVTVVTVGVRIARSARLTW